MAAISSGTAPTHQRARLVVKENRCLLVLSVTTGAVNWVLWCLLRFLRYFGECFTLSGRSFAVFLSVQVRFEFALNVATTFAEGFR